MGSHRPPSFVPYGLLRDQLRADYPDLPMSTIELALDRACRAAVALDEASAGRQLAVLARDRLDAARVRARAAVATVRPSQQAAAI